MPPGVLLSWGDLSGVVEQEEAGPVKAAVGDRIVVASNKVEGPVRDGRVVECRHADGSPPYVVEWADGQRGLFFPGPDASVDRGAADAGPAADVPELLRVKTWRIEVQLYEGDTDTRAHAVLVTDEPHLEARGSAHRAPDDREDPLVGDEVAVARALRRLSDRLLQEASSTISLTEGRSVSLRA